MHRGQQAQREEAVRDRSAERALALRALDVDVDPLVIAGQVGETVDHVLGDFDRVAPVAEGVGDLRLQLRDVVETDFLHDGPPGPSLPAGGPGPPTSTAAGAPNGRGRAGGGEPSPLP